MLTNKQKKKLLKNRKHQVSSESDYISQMKRYRELFSDFPDVKFLINNVLESDHLIKSKLLPQELPELLLPEDIQDQIFKAINQRFDRDDPEGDKLWNQLSDALPKLDKALRSYRDYLEEQYGMWAYISGPFVKSLAAYIDHEAVLEIMAGNGYISKGLQDLNVKAYPTDSLEWLSENQTGKHQVTQIEKLDAVSAIEKYQDKVKYVIMSWAPDKGSVDLDVLNAIRKADHDLKLIVIGERNGATDSKAFWQQAHIIEPEVAKKLNAHHKPFDLIKDQVYLVD